MKFRMWNPKLKQFDQSIPDDIPGVEMVGVKRVRVYPGVEYELEQSTGKLDRNGKEIFEKDFVLVNENTVIGGKFYLQYPQTALVLWSSGWVLVSDRMCLDFELFDPHTVEVVSCIHDHHNIFNRLANAPL